jgi:hypothetical protein
MPVIAIDVTLNTTDPIPKTPVPRRSDVHVRFYTTDGSTVTITFTDPPGSPFVDCGNPFEATGETGHTCAVSTSAGLGSHAFRVTASTTDPRDGDLDITPGG